MLVHGRHVSGLLVPLPMVIIGHHVDPVEVGGNLGHVVTSVHDRLARTHSSGQKQTLRLEGSREFLDPGGEGGLVLVPLLLALSLPAAGVLPVQVQTVEVVLLDEADDVLDEPGAGSRVVHQAAVLVSLAVVPTSQGEGHLMPCFLNSVTFLYMSLPEYPS